MTAFAEIVERRGAIPLCWAGSGMRADYVNVGDALSPVMVALVSGRPIERVPFRSREPRMAAVGTIGHGVVGGEAWVWGSGSSNLARPSTGDRTPYAPPPGTRLHLAATRGPVSRGLLGGRDGPDLDGVFGDPVWLLPRFYDPKIERTAELGVIVHLSELESRALDTGTREELIRYHVPPSLRGAVRIINTISAPTTAGIKAKLDEILACKRIVSTSLHGLVFAESYGIPCLHFQQSAHEIGPAVYPMRKGANIDLRILDLYMGLKVEKLPVYMQPLSLPTDWDKLIRVVDKRWTPRTFDGDALIAAFPMATAPVSAPEGGTVFDLPLVRDMQLRHSFDLRHWLRRSAPARRLARLMRTR
ncbi:polysaccharide pyruvyl transferase family protein [Oharaeibacter diazotrophicus]|uniref:Polysaccharide pyruvyl transferase n=2 Tax=Oharaeibacter diazotrophicus TaxID=1920512 RepID=A0A4R6R7L6_9HYPH|nr:polysaccharide pyruvyl transferase family protein [Oharaeibacter diazotrophicus]TDP81963.1 polysaccharide pyruvyl transferase [Oharaeibacter diazotrophicus]BBE73595.1 polysaccharide pyruvyl transferase [Pleomorphomonas sp. SM30]GLS75385.1 exopolysaccharide glucosyl ketal-pyruvate-transferase [Oharaeibacter diazotrophicus]